MIENARGVVLRTRRLTESSLIVSWLTAQSGRVSTVAKGALRPKSAFAGKLDLFYVADFSFSRSRRSELHTLREVRLIQSQPLVRTELAALQQASYCAALIEQTTEVDTPLSGIFDMMIGFLSSFQTNEKGVFFSGPERVFALELRLLAELGLQPDFSASRVSQQTRTSIEHLQTATWDEISRTALPAQTANELRRFLHGFLIYNFGRLARGREAAAAERR